MENLHVQSMPRAFTVKDFLGVPTFTYFVVNLLMYVKVMARNVM